MRWTVAGRGRAPDPFDVQRHAPFLGREVPVVTRTEFRDTGFTQAHLRGGRLAGWHTVAGLVEQCVRAIDAGEKFVYAYYPGVDTIAHEFGLHDRVFARELAFVDALRRRADRRAPAQRRAARHLRSRPGAPRSASRGSRSPSCSRCSVGGRRRRPLPLPLREPEHPQGAARPGARALLGPRLGVVALRGARDRGCSATGATGTVPGRIGSVVLAAREPVAFVDPSLPNERTLRSGHGSLTPDEMYVPLLAAEQLTSRGSDLRPSIARATSLAGPASGSTPDRTTRQTSISRVTPAVREPALRRVLDQAHERGLAEERRLDARHVELVVPEPTRSPGTSSATVVFCHDLLIEMHPSEP